MVTKELSEAAVELNSIFDNMDDTLLKKIPKKFRNWFKEIVSKEYKFEYDKNKKLNEQQISKETRGLLALIYKNYICDKEEKEAYIKKCNTILKQIDDEKREKYSPEKIFEKNKKDETNIEQEVSKELYVVPKKTSFISRLIEKIKNFFNKK